MILRLPSTFPSAPTPTPWNWRSLIPFTQQIWSRLPMASSEPRCIKSCAPPILWSSILLHLLQATNTTTTVNMLEGLSEEASTLSPLPPILSKGLIAVSLCGLLSFIASTGLFLYLTYRIIDWRIKNGYSQPLNQLLVLIYSLLFADIQQAMAFLLNFDSIRNNAIRVGTTTCWAQGWFVSTGDLASSVMITAIGIHTLLGIVKGYRPSTIVFYSCLAGCWIFIYLLGALGPWLYGADFYVRASAWVSHIDVRLICTNIDNVSSAG